MAKRTIELDDDEIEIVKQKVYHAINNLKTHDDVRKRAGKAPEYSGRLETLRGIIAKLDSAKVVR